MELYERKYTTNAGLKQMQRLFESLNEHLADDISNFDGNKTFFCRVEGDNGLFCNDLNFRSWKMTVATIVYRDGEFEIYVEDEPDIEYCHTDIVAADEFVDRIEKIDFQALIEALEDAVELYNNNSLIKDESIERFLRIVGEYSSDATNI